jgi:hypothetical protein
MPCCSHSIPFFDINTESRKPFRPLSAFRFLLEPLKANRWRHRREPNRDHNRMDGANPVGRYALERTYGSRNQLRRNRRESV